ncbi:MAG: phospholipase D-like domain-containing protein [Planctomycetota bacterium]|jgi:hypothetical protein
MATKIPVIIDNRGNNTMLHALRRLLPNLQGMDIATGVFEVGSFLLLERYWQTPDMIRVLNGID